MPKFYVQCGPIRTILAADSVDQAALAALDPSLQTHLWIYDDPDLCEACGRDHLMVEALLHLEPTMRISQRGFDRSDADRVETHGVIDDWHRLMIGISRLFAAAGLYPRSMQQVATGKPLLASAGPRRPR